MISKNPVIDGYYADPEALVHEGKVYLYVTCSKEFDLQKNLDLVITEDLVNYRKVQNILDMETFVGATRAIWAPTIIEKDNKFYLIFAANDIHSESEVGGLYVGVCDRPDGIFKNIFSDGRPLLNKIINGAQPIDAHLFKDDDGTIYLYYGGWRHLNVCIMTEDMKGFKPFSDGEIFKEITPENYVEAPCMLKKDGKYFLMYSSGSWGNGTYAVHYSLSTHQYENIKDNGTILCSSPVANGPGHNGFFIFDGQYYIAYHRRPIEETKSDNRVLCVDKLEVQDDKILPVIMT